MKFKFIDYYRLPATLYSIELYREKKEMPLSESEFRQIIDLIRYYSRKDNVSWLAVYSTTDSNTAKPTTIKTGKRGRPKKRIEGIKVKGHLHTVLMGDTEKSAYKTAEAVKKYADKKYGKKVCRVVSKGHDIHAYNMIDYCYRQADIERSGGDFNFREYIDQRK